MLTLQLEMMEAGWAQDHDGQAPGRQLTSYQRATNSLRRTLYALVTTRVVVEPKNITPMDAEQAREALRKRGIVIDGNALRTPIQPNERENQHVGRSH